MRPGALLGVLIFSAVVCAAATLVFPSDEEVIARLERRGQVPEVLARLTRDVVETPRPVEARLLVRAARLLDQHGKRLAATAAYERLTREHPAGGGFWISLAGLRREALDLPGERAALERAVTHAPGSLDAWRRLAQIRRIAQEDSPRVEALERLVQITSGDERASYQAELARLHLGRGRLRPGVQQLEAYLELAPSDLPAWLLRLDVASLEGASEAAAVTSRLLLASKQPLQDGLAASEVLSEAGQVTLAEGLVRRLLLENPREAAVLRRSRDLAYARGDRVAVLTAIGLLLEQRPRDPSLWRERAEVLEALQRSEDALAAWRTLAGITPEDPQPVYQLVDLLLSLGRAPEAVSELQDLLRRSPRDARARALLIEAALAVPDFPLAARLLREDVRAAPSDPEAALRLAEVELWRGDLDRATAAWKRLFELRDDAESLRQVAQLHEWREDLAAEAEARLELMRREPQDRSSALRLAALAEVRGFLPDQLRVLERFLELNPGAAGVRRLLARTLLDRGRGREALPHLRVLTSAAPGDLELERLFVQSLVAAGLATEAQQLLRELIATRELERVRFAGQLALEVDQLDLGLEAYLVVTELDPQDAEAAFLCGKIYIWRSRHALALPYLQKAIELEPERGVAHALLADALENLDPRDPKALRHHRFAFRLLSDAKTPEGLLYYAYSGHRIGREREALRALGVLLQADPSVTSARLLRARVLASMGQVEGARREVRPLRRQRPRDLDVLATEAWVEMTAGDPKAALPLYERVAAQPDADLGPLLDYANLLSQEGRASEAARVYERVVRESRQRRRQ